MNQCDGCQRGLPVHNGVHCGEFEMIECKRGHKLELEPIERDTWHQPEKRVKSGSTFTSGS